jgi:CMP-N,N'-diacetyllegionaminic acid synthase
MNVAIIPARSGSKGIPDKNMSLIWDTSLIALAAKCIQATHLYDKIILSTDSQRYAEEGKKHGCEIPYLRPMDLSEDRSSINDVILDIFSKVEGSDKWNIISLIEPTCPLRTPAMIKESLHVLENNRLADACIGVVPVPVKYNPIKQFLPNGDFLSHATEKGGGIINRQQLPVSYIRSGLVYHVKRTSFLKYKSFVDGNVIPYEVNDLLVNIDTQDDLEKLATYVRHHSKPEWA